MFNYGREDAEISQSYPLGDFIAMKVIALVYLVAVSRVFLGWCVLPKESPFLIGANLLLFTIPFLLQLTMSRGNLAVLCGLAQGTATGMLVGCLAVFIVFIGKFFVYGLAVAPALLALCFGPFISGQTAGSIIRRLDLTAYERERKLGYRISAWLLAGGFGLLLWQFISSFVA